MSGALHLGLRDGEQRNGLAVHIGFGVKRRIVCTWR